jgi:hypothetical protein
MNPRLRSNLIILGVTLVGAVALVAVKRMGLVDGDTITRISMAGIGLMVAWYGNIAPKQAAPASARRIAYRRFLGYAIAVAGLVNAAIWAWAPMAFAPELSMAPLIAAFAIILGYCLWLRRPAAQA